MIKKFDLGFSAIMIILEVLLISYISYVDYVDLQIITSNSLVSDRSVTVFFKGSHVPSVYELVKRYPEITIVSELYNYPDLQVWGFCGNCSLDSRTKSLIEGVFFKQDDFFWEDFKAVVGKNVLNSDNCFEDKDSKMYFKFNDYSYEVIGTISSNISNMLDNTAFVNLDSFEIKFRKLIIDGVDSQSIINAINGIKEEYDIDIIRENNNFIERYMYNDVDIHILDILVIIFIGMLMIALSVFTLRCYDEEIRVKRIIGISFNRILYDMLKDIISIIIANTAFVTAIYAILYRSFIQNYHLGFQLLPLAVSPFIILTAICLITYLYMLMSSNFFCIKR